MEARLHSLKVQTLDQHRLADASANLAAKIYTFRPESFKPDVLIGIRTGGFKVAEAMVPSFPDAALLPITCRRPSTKKKQNSSLLKKLLRKLPEGITSPLRIIEHIVLTQLPHAHKKNVFIPDNKELSTIENRLRQYGKALNILIIDDSVDSGATLAAVVGIISNMAGPTATVKTAVITVTTASPFIEPDFLLYRYVLCRFPWSFDFKN